ncbi:hypothetical protein EC912_101379 [Luteibacter rhizovicinus]|uniref:Uncharacterized protein n=1 Tax=Luteibacter rhizovicinus TaxID=242606 RepID=A0A4R3YXL4_9GAMM|nr:hypothetical protein [Luteibacter rhizovicinus]TCV97370.1 hypothetical protein EC912_101379 [Luteibacter rhizovicinus]
MEHSIHESYVRERKVELVSTARAMLDGTLGLIEGVRRLNDLRFQIDDPDSPVFHTVRVVESDMDEVPVGDIRSRFGQTFLQQKDAEVADYLGSSADDIQRACREIISRFEMNMDGSPAMELRGGEGAETSRGKKL